MGHFERMFEWSSISAGITAVFPGWAREVAAVLQVLPLILVPFVAVVQTCRYCLYAPGDASQRLQLLYGPTFPGQMALRDSSGSGRNVVLTNFTAGTGGNGSRESGRRERRRNAVVRHPPANDPPPKYTPPPSYSTATGARLARMLRQSFRQSVRRLRDVAAAVTVQAEATASVHAQPEQQPTSIVDGAGAFVGHESMLKADGDSLPPDYAAVFVNASAQSSSAGAGDSRVFTSADDSSDGGATTELDDESINVSINAFGTLNSCYTVVSELPTTAASTPSGTLLPRRGATVGRHSHSVLLHGPLNFIRPATGPGSFRYMRSPPSSSCAASGPLSLNVAPRPSVPRVDSRAVLIRSVEPFDRIETENTGDDEYSIPVEENAIEEQVQEDTITESPVPGYSCDFPAFEFEEECAPSAPPATEAMNTNVSSLVTICDNGEADREAPSTVVLDVDMSASVI